MGDAFINGGDEFGHAGEQASTQPIDSKVITVLGLTSSTAAILRVIQCVAASGLPCVVNCTNVRNVHLDRRCATRQVRLDALESGF